MSESATRRIAVLRDLLLVSLDGDWGKEDAESGGLPYRVIRGTDFASVRAGSITGVPLRYLTAASAERRALRAGDVLIETAGGSKGRPTGRTLLLRQSMVDAFDYPITCASFARFLRLDNGRCYPPYIFWFLQNLYQLGKMEQHQVQHTGVARFQFTRFAETEPIELPSVTVQRAIAEMLGVLDDKIEANSTCVRITWELAYSQFKELTQGGERRVVALGDLIELAYGKSLPGRSREPGSVPVYGSGGVVGSHRDYLVTGPGVVVGRKGTAGVVHWAPDAFFPIDTTFYVAGAKVPMEFAYFTLRDLHLEKMNYDSAVPGLNRTAALDRVVVAPGVEHLEAFGRRARVLTDSIAAVERESRVLGQLRDLLLPGLMSGEIRVREAEAVVGEAV